MKPFTIRGGRHTTVERYGYEFIAARARRGMLAKELAKVLHPERLTAAEIEAIRRQVMVRQAAVMRAAQAAKRAARQVAGQPAENEQ
jgi:ribosome-binding protein aMBF1 (putative translation factor)